MRHWLSTYCVLEPQSCEGDLESAYFQEKLRCGVVKVVLNVVCQMQGLCLPIMLVSMCTHIHTFTHLSVYPHICPPIHPSVHLHTSARPSIHPYTSTHFSAHPSTHPSTHSHISIYVSCVHPSVHLCIHASLHIPTSIPIYDACIHISMLFLHPSSVIFYFGFSFVSDIGPGPALGALTREDLVAMGGGSDTA